MAYYADMTDLDHASIRLICMVNGKPMDYVVRLVWTRFYNGGRRWFLCPKRRDDEKVARRVAKLPLPPGAKYFGNCEAYGLTYRSAQKSEKLTRFSGKPHAILERT